MLMYLRTPIPNDIKVLGYSRYSKEEQRQQSTEDQFQFTEGFLGENGGNSSLVERISDEGMSGDRVKAGIEQRRWKLILVEDSSRLFRGIAPCMDLVGRADELGIRVICINDQVDTQNDDWVQRLEEAQRHHGQDNYYTRFRIKRSLEGLWRMGAAIGLLRSGYRRHRQNPDSPKSPKFDEIDPQWVPVIVQAFKMVAQLAPWDVIKGTRYPLAPVCNYLTAAGLPKRSNSKSPVWNERNVVSLIRCELYRGVEFYREEISKKQHTTGKSGPIPNPDPSKILKRDMPHLRMLEDWLWFKANAVIDDRARPGSFPSGQDHPLHGIPRDSRSLLSNIFVCGICGNKMYAEGRNEGGYRCGAAKDGNCWNKATCLRGLTHSKVCAAITKALLEITPGTIDRLVRHVESQLTDRGRFLDEQRLLAKRGSELELKQQRLLRIITETDSPPDFVTAEIAKLDAERKRLNMEELHVQAQIAEHPVVPCQEQIMERLQHFVATANLGNQDSREILRRLIDGPIKAVPHQPFGNSNVVLRAELSLRLVRLMPDDLGSLLNGKEEMNFEGEAYQTPLSLDLFIPSKPHEHAIRAMEIYRANLEAPPTMVKLGKQLGISTRNAHLALQMGKEMASAGLTDPFTRLSECPPNPARWRFKDAS
jgi:hypothetical protein